MSASCLYEPRVVTRVPLAAFHSNEVEEQGQWSVPVSVIRPHSLCVATANMLHILDISLSDTMEEEPGHNGVPVVFEFKCSVDAIGWSSDAALLVAGDRHGVLHFVSPTIERVLFSQGLESAATKNKEQNEPVFKVIEFVPTLTEGVLDLLVLCASGVVFIFRNIGIRRISEAIEISDGEALKKLRGEIELVKLDLSDVHSGGSFSLHPLGTLSNHLEPPSLITCGCGESGLCVWRRTAGEEGSGYVLQDSVGCLLQGLGIVKCETTSDGRFLVTQDSSGTLEVWLLSFLIVVNVWTSSKVKHFSLCQGLSNGTTMYTATESAAGCTDRLCLVTEGCAGKELRIVSLPDFDPIHSMSVDSAAALFTGDVSEDSLYYLDIDDSEEKPAIVVKQLVLALPENRLATLLSQQKFEEAEAFATKFDLDPEMVYKSKAKVLNSLLWRAGSEEESETATSSLLQCLGHIKENAFIVDLVLRSPYPTLDSTLQLLQFTHKKLQRGGSKSNDASSIKAKVALALNKLVTFQMIDSEERFSPKAWQLFQEGSLLHHLRHYLQLGDLHKAGCIWSRHLTALVNELDANNLLPLLECVPDSVPSPLLTSWLAQNTVPFLLQHIPQALGGFLQFIDDRVRLLELTEKEHWPRNGLNMVSTLIESIRSFKNPAAKMAIQPHSLTLVDFSDNHCSPLSNLRNLQNRLNDLCYLHSTLKCSITLSDHEKESQEAVVFRLLDEVIAAELVTTTIRSKVIPYVNRHKLQLDATLFNYIKLFLSHSPRYSTGLTDSPFESKAIALVQAIQDRELYVLSCVELLKHVHTPWSESVEELVQECLKVDHPVGVAMLEKQYSLLQLKKLLHGYGIRDFNFSDTSKGWLYIRRILISEGLSVLEDALKVGEMYQLNVSDIYKHHLMNLGRRDNMGEAAQLLHSLEREKQVTTAQKTFSFAFSVLNLSFSTDLDDPDDYIGAAKVSILCLKVLDTALREGRGCVLSEDWTSVPDSINLFQRLLALQIEFSLFLSPSELGNREKCQQLFTERVKILPTVISSQSADSSAKHYHDAIRYCHLLGFSEEEFYEELALVCAKQSKQDQAMDICWELVKSSPRPSVALLVMAVVRETWERAVSQAESISREDVGTVRKLAAYATALCHQSTLLDTVEMFRLCVLIDCLYQQCESGMGEDRNNSSDFLEWRWSPRFKEDGLILDQSALLSTALRYCLVRLPLKPEQLNNRVTGPLSYQPRQAALSRNNIQSLLNIAAQLSQVLQDNGHNLLTLQCSTQTLAAYSHHTATMVVADSPTSSYPFLQQGQSLNREILNSLVTKILSSRRLDHDYALSLLLVLPPHLAVGKLKAIRTRNISSFSKVIALCKLTINYSIVTCEPSVMEHSVSILNSAQWGKRLGAHKISFTEAFRGGLEERKKVASTLFRSKRVEMELILDYCREMLNFEPQAVLASYLRILLTEWEDIHACQERAAAVIRQIQNKDVVNQMLLNLLMNKIKPYDYDRIAFILSQLVGVGMATTAKPEQGLVLLDCLRRYTRVSPPTDYEKNLFASRFAPQPTAEEQSTEIALPEAALKHLPFHLLLYGAPMKVIEAELLSPANVEKMMPISRILQLPVDDFYSCAIKRIVTVSQQSNKSELDFSLLSQFLLKIQEFQYAMEICKWLAKQLPKEDDRTEILKSGLDLAMQYRNQAKTEQEQKAAGEKVKMFHELWRIAQTDQVLKHYHLDSPEYLEMSRLGASLLMTLYTDLSVTKTTPAIPVHSVAAEIAKIHNINVDKIISRLTEKWLLSTNSSSTDMNITQSSLLEDPTEDGSDVEDSEDTLNMKRLVYLLSVPEKLEKHSVMLLRWAQQTSSSSSSSRVRALQILFTIVPPSLIEKVSGKSITEIKDLMQSTMFVAELEALHMSTKLSAFQACNKEGLVRTLWRNHAQEPRALRLICELCLYYHIRDPTLWANLLEQLLCLEMLPYLRHVLKVLASLSGLSNITSLASIWQKALLSTFQGVSPPLGDYQKQECTSTLDMMYSCPFPFELDVGEIVTGFCSVDLHTHALASLLIVPSQAERSRLLNQVMKPFNKKEQYVSLLDELARLHQTTGGHFKEATELVYVYLNSGDKHELLLGSSHFTPFMHYLISKKLMKSLVTKTLQLNRIKDAIQLVEIYNSKHNPQTQLHGLDALQDYLTVNGINGFDGGLLLYES